MKVKIKCKISYVNGLEKRLVCGVTADSQFFFSSREYLNKLIVESIMSLYRFHGDNL